ncbi:hypothetical protein TNCV_2376601 [Trichonephila clavipes]|nr:hypothetical protein TNCV_2376601 [Trichonephila clavipes]
MRPLMFERLRAKVPYLIVEWVPVKLRKIVVSASHVSNKEPVAVGWLVSNFWSTLSSLGLEATKDPTLPLVEQLMHVKFVKAQSPHVEVVEKFEERAAR